MRPPPPGPRCDAASGVTVDATTADAAIGDGIVVLDRVHRFGTGIATVAGAVRAGDADGLVDALRGGGSRASTWLEDDAHEPIREGAVAAAPAA